ncbi:MAG TPA: hypothetical protein DCW31_10915 [Lactobacillus sp.]|nr:hypothetical protein [Lactobacillus sp.]
MLNDNQYDYDIERLGKLRDELQRLEDNDYVTAFYKGYSSEGLTLEEVRENIRELEGQVRQLERQLDEDADQ